MNVECAENALTLAFFSFSKSHLTESSSSWVADAVESEPKQSADWFMSGISFWYKVNEDFSHSLGFFFKFSFVWSYNKKFIHLILIRMFMCSFFTCYRCGCTSSLQGSIISLLPLQSVDTFDILHFALFLCAYCFNFYSTGYIRALKITWLGSRKGCSLAAKAIFIFLSKLSLLIKGACKEKASGVL